MAVPVDFEPGTDEPKISREEAAGLLAQVLFGQQSEDTDVNMNFGWVDGIATVATFGVYAAGKAVATGVTNALGSFNSLRSDQKQIVEAMVDQLPDEALYSSIVRRMDPRPVLAATTDDPVWKVLAADGSGNVRIFERLTEQLDERAEKVARDVAARKGIPDDEIDAWVTTAAAAPATGALSLEAQLADDIAANGGTTETPTVNADGTPALPMAGGGTTPAVVDPNDPFPDDIDADINGTPFDWDSMMRVFENTGGNFDELLRIENQTQGQFADAGLDPNQVSARIKMPADMTDTGSNRPMNGTQTMSAAQALNFLYQMPESQVKNWEERMRKAGYYDQLGQASTFTGYAWDEANGEAWKLLLSDAAKANVTIDVALAQATTRYEKLLDERGMDPLFDERGRQQYNDQGQKLVYDARGRASVYEEPVVEPEVTVLTNANDIRWDADGRAVSLLDRYLREDELAAVADYVHEMERTYQDKAREVALTGGEIEDFNATAAIDTWIKMRTRVGDDGQLVEMSADEAAERYLRPASRPTLEGAGRPTVTPAEPSPLGNRSTSRAASLDRADRTGIR